MRRTRLIATGVVLALVAALAPVHAQTNVPVTVSNTANTRVIHVENMLGAPLTSLDFGQGRSLPFRIRVVDSALIPATFTVNATMTRVYRDGGQLNQYIPSSQVSLGRQVNALAAKDVVAIVQPVLDLTATIADPVICGILGLTPVAGSCTLNATNVLGTITQLALDTTGLLSGLPLVPQLNETGPFTNAEFGVAPASSDPDAAAAAPATPRKVAQSSLGNALAQRDGLLGAVDIDDLLSDQAITAALAAANAAVSLLTVGQLGTLVSSTVATLKDLVQANLLSLTGTYLSFPTLDIDTSGASAGSFTGTLVLTSVQ